MKNVSRALLIVTAAAVSSQTTSLAWAVEPPGKEAPKDPSKDKDKESAAQKEGREHFLRGVDFSRDGDFRAALIEFRRAYELAPNYRVLYNIGQTALELQEYAQSLEAFEMYLTEGGTDIPADRRQQVENEVKRLSNRVANVTVTVNIPNASISIDDIIVAQSPLDHPIRIGAGRHKFSASSADTIPASRVVELAGGEATTVNLELVSLDRPQGGAEGNAALAPAPPAAPSKTPLWIGIGVTGALAIGTVVMGIITLGKKDDFDTQLSHYLPNGNRSEIDSARSSMKTSALVFDVLAAATIVAGGATLVYGLTSSHKKEQTAAKLPGWVTGTF